MDPCLSQRRIEGVRRLGQFPTERILRQPFGRSRTPAAVAVIPVPRRAAVRSTLKALTVTEMRVYRKTDRVVVIGFLSAVLKADLQQLVSGNLNV